MNFRRPSDETKVNKLKEHNEVLNLSTQDFTNTLDTSRIINLAQESTSSKKVEITPFTLPEKKKKLEDCNAGDYYYQTLELQLTDYSAEVLRQEGVSFNETSEIRTSFMFKEMSLQQLQELRFKDPEQFENLRMNGYRRQADSQKKLSCTML